jgi:integrase
MYEAWMLNVEASCKPLTIKSYKSRWTLHLKPYFGTTFATSVTKDTVVAYLNQRMKEGAGVVSRNRENRILQLIFGFNEDKIPADHYPKFPKLISERDRVRKGRLSKSDFETITTRLDNPKVFWLKVFVTMMFKYGFRRAELMNATCGYFDSKASTFTLPAYMTKNKTERPVDLQPNGEIFRMLVRLTEGRATNAALFTRNGKPVRDFRHAWDKLTADCKGGSGKGGAITLHDLRRSAITNMSEKNIDATKAGTHLTAELFARYVSRDVTERRETAKIIEGD